MKTSIQQKGNCRSTAQKLLPLAMATIACAMFMSPAMAQHDDRHDDNHGRADNRGHVEVRHDHDRGRGYGDRRWHDQRQPYYYAQPVYVPPTVYAEPEPSAGISIFLPIRLRH
jgi:hypothetical protein